jgi:hypothetical protein
MTGRHDMLARDTLVYDQIEYKSFPIAYLLPPRSNRSRKRYSLQISLYIKGASKKPYCTSLEA